jgi:hypothetical protein
MELVNGEPKDCNSVYWKADVMHCLIKLEWFLEWTAENGLGEAIASSFIMSLHSSKDREQNYEHLCDDSWTAKGGFTLLFMKKRLMHFFCASRLFLVYKSMNDNEI